MSRTRLQLYKRVNMKVARGYSSVCMKTSNFVMLTENILLLQGINKEKFAELDAVDFMEEIYLQSPRYLWFNTQFQFEGTDTCNILYIVNDRASNKELMEGQRYDDFTDIAESMNDIELINFGKNKKTNFCNRVFLTDCVLCHLTCSIFHNLPKTKKMSSIFGICTDCNAKEL